MEGRLLRLFILLAILFSTNTHILYGQTNLAFKSLSPKQRKSVKKQIKFMSQEDKLLSFTCFDSKTIDENGDGKGAVMLDRDNKEGVNEAPEGLVKLYNTNNLTYHTTPFPSLDIIRRSNQSSLEWLPHMFSADYLIDLDINSTALYYGLDTVDVFADATPYFDWNNLHTSIIKHDFIYTSDSLNTWLEKFKTNSTDQFLKQLDDKLRISLASKLTQPTAEEVATPTQKNTLQWIWETYTNAITTDNSEGILPLTNLDQFDMCTYSFGEDFSFFNKALNRNANVPGYQAEDLSVHDKNRLTSYDLVIIPVSVLTDKQKTFIKDIALETQILLVQFENEVLKVSDSINARVVSVPENNWLTQSIVAEKLFADNSSECESILNHGLPELVGLSADSLHQIDLLVKEAIDNKAIPGCQILVAKDGYVVMNKAYGFQTYDSLVEITDNTIYDLASITKVLATTQAIMFLVDQGLINLDDKLSSHLPYLTGTNKEKITIREVMAHQAGLYPYYSLWQRAKEKLLTEELDGNNTVQAGKNLFVNETVGDSILMWAAISEMLAERIDTVTMEQYLYSDIGFYLLKDLIEKQTEQTLDSFLAEKLYNPLGAKLVFNPTCYYPTSNIAPTESDRKLRKEQVQGFVHDRNAALLGGVAGQAGLFGNAYDVAKILQLQLNGGCYGGERYFNTSTVEQFLSRQYDHNRRALGWDRPGLEPDGPISELASDETFGHTGFTGGSIWADPKENLIFVFLSNRVYPLAENTKLIDLNIRTRIQDLVYRSTIK